MKDLEIIVTAFQRPNLLRTLLSSLYAQTLSNMNIRVIHDGYDSECKKIVEAFLGLNTQIELSYSYTQMRHNDYGHSLRQIGLERSSAEYTLITNDDNYYTPNFVQEMIGEARKSESDVVYCDMVHSHIRYDQPNPIGYQAFITKPHINYIDMGSFIFRTDLGKKVGFKSRSFEADGVFFEELKNNTERITKVKKILFVHN